MEKKAKTYSPKKHSFRGASLLEYSVLLALILLIILGGMRFMGESVSQQFSEVGSTMTNE